MKYTLQNTIEKFQKKENIEFLFFWGHTVKEELQKLVSVNGFLLNLKKKELNIKLQNII
ncbi:hypothetical protein SAMN05421682_10968 [Chryseobacterium indoltheticum]|uniref:Uncharacterized protein n=1 Tax=Chryseobacterium indoltheticum TaxID=254 RepID=A0A381F6H5_9FLAO|nr:hypothetical protein SAMN05421682_10968 [Chryseobacterium indoltheticum]SUX42054.1 Uncharacterised protein [Chryseobacterium indoltheticum]